MEQTIKKWKEINLTNYIKRNPKNLIPEAHLNTIEQWLRSSEASRHRKRLSKLSIPDALKLSQKWESKHIQCLIPQLKDSGSSIIKQYTDGFSWVKLNTNEAYSYEGILMKHCVYDHRKKTDCLIFSLRNPNNYPICTVEILRDGTLNQFKGKFNNQVNPLYHKYLIDFFINDPVIKIKKASINASEIIYLGYCYIQNQAYSLTNLPLEAPIHHNVKLFNNDIKKFNCKKMIIWGNLDLNQLDHLEELPHHLIVYGDVNIAYCSKLKRLPKILQVSGAITIDSCTQLKEFPLFLKSKLFQITNCGFLNWKCTKNIIIESHISCFKTYFNQEFLNKFKLTNDSGTWRTYKMNFHSYIIESVKYIINTGKKIFDFFAVKN